MIKKLSILFIVLVLAGCATTKDVTVIEPKTILITPPDELTTKCTVDAPPGSVEYVNSDWNRKEELLINHSAKQMKNLFKCNEMINSLNEWKKKQIEIYKPAK